MDTSLDQLLDMTIPCLSMQMQSFGIFAIEHFYSFFNNIFLVSLFVRFFEHNMIGNFNKRK